MPTLVLFDFDGTITTKDSLLHFTAYAKGKLSLYKGLLLLFPLLLLNKYGIVSSQLAKNSFLEFFFTNFDKEKFNGICKRYAETGLKTIIRSAALEKIKWHKQQNHRIIVVSASPENYIQPWCDALGIECIATRLAVNGQKICGGIEGLNCNGEEKKTRVKTAVDLSYYDEIYGYGDTSGDKAMLSICTKPYYRYF